MIKVVLIGDSGHAKVIEDILLANKYYTIHAKLDSKYLEKFTVEDIIKGPVRLLDDLIEKDPNLKVVISIGSNDIREKVVGELSLDDSQYLTIIHPTAIIGSNINIENGSVVMPNAIINSNAKIGKHVIINTNAVIEHDCIVNDFVHISPSATLTGGVCIGEGTHIGANASITPMKKVGEWSVIGAGSVVNKNIPPNVTAVGVPAKVIKER